MIRIEVARSSVVFQLHAGATSDLGGAAVFLASRPPIISTELCFPSTGDGSRASASEGKTMKRQGQIFAFDRDIAWEPAGAGIRRKILTFDAAVMMVRVAFEAGAVGALHSHPHVQCSLVEEGAFDINIAGRTEHL